MLCLSQPGSMTVSTPHFEKQVTDSSIEVRRRPETSRLTLLDETQYCSTCTTTMRMQMLRCETRFLNLSLSFPASLTPSSLFLALPFALALSLSFSLSPSRSILSLPLPASLCTPSYPAPRLTLMGAMADADAASPIFLADLTDAAKSSCAVTASSSTFACV